MEAKKYKQNKDFHTPQVVSEPQAAYGIDANALKLAGIDALMRISNPSTVEKAVKELFKSANLPWIYSETAEEETISKAEILAGIREGLREMKERKLTGKKGQTLQELIDEL